MKTCSKCGLEKKLDQFRIRNKKTELRRNECNACNRIKHKKWRDENPGVNRKYYDKAYEKTRFQYCKHCGNRYRLVSSGGYCSKKCYLFGKIEIVENGCWNWKGQLNISGYGKASLKDICIAAHRLSYLEFKGNINDKLYVLHTCDNRKCCNPDHLYLGTPKENTQDMIKKGRASWQRIKN